MERPIQNSTAKGNPTGQLKARGTAPLAADSPRAVEESSRFRRDVEKRHDWILAMERGRLRRLEFLVSLGILEDLSNFGASGLAAGSVAGNALGAQASWARGKSRFGWLANRLPRVGAK